MSKRHHEQVLQTVRDLTAQTTKRRRANVEVPEGELPTGVAARLALDWTGRVDRALVTGGAARGTEQTKTARRELLAQSVGEAALLELLEALSLPVRARGGGVVSSRRVIRFQRVSTRKSIWNVGRAC